MLAGTGFPPSWPRAALSRTSPSELGQKFRLASGLRPRLLIKAATTQASASNDQIFNRREELAFLQQRFDNRPREVLILLGPANCGKTVSFSGADHLLLN